MYMDPMGKGLVHVALMMVFPPSTSPLPHSQGDWWRLSWMLSVSAVVEQKKVMTGREKLFVYTTCLGGGFKHFLFSSLFGEDFQFD